MAAEARWASRRALQAVLLALALLVSGSWFGGELRAEPYLAVREGYKCSKCHVNKTGGGKRTEYGVLYMHSRGAASVLSSEYTPRAEKGAEPPPPVVSGDFAHGRLSENFSVGADVRVPYNYVYPSGNEQPRNAFGRDATCESCHKSLDGGGKLAEFYLDIAVIPGRASLYVSENLIPTVATRDVFVLLEGLPYNGYLKTGTFRMPTSLLNVFDDPFLHGGQKLGTRTSMFDGVLGLEAVQGMGVEYGIEPGSHSLSLTVTNPADPTAVPADKRIVANAYTVRRAGLVGIKYSLDPLTEDASRTVSSLYGGLHFGRLTGLFELDRVAEDNASGGGKTYRTAGMGELDFLVAKGQNVKFAYEFLDPDTSKRGDTRDRTSFIYEPFLSPNLQFRAGYRIKQGRPSSDTTANERRFFLELHFLY
ncbi:MAG: hypothetical protein HY423_07825 [Candidatus Lambdaproteobacteria bacterium]|nr:hypothetical protein [Candidatus Lambdaproteobacteria bacterium]